MEALFISDIHLGSKSCMVNKFLELLQSIEENLPKRIFIIGDFIDGWKFSKNKFQWKDKEIKVIRKLLKFMQRGVHITYIAGNHDSFIRKYIDPNIVDNFCILDEYILETPDNKKYLLIHGDQFDAFIKHKYVNKWLMYLGDSCYETVIKISRLYMRAFKSNFSISKYIKYKFKNAMMFISSFEETLENHAHMNKCYGVICGHIHCPKISNDQKYINTGDFVENCSYVWMNEKGKFFLETV